MAVLTKHKKRLGEILVDLGVVSPLEIDEALERQRLNGELLGRILVDMQLCEEQDIVEALGVQSGMERVDINKMQVSDEVLSLVPADMARFYNVAPVRMRDGVLTVAMADPLNLSVLDDLRQVLGRKIEGAVSNPHDVHEFIANNYSSQTNSIEDTLSDLAARVGENDLTAEELGTQQLIGEDESLVALAQEPEIIRLVNTVMMYAVQHRASDIHFETFEDDFRIRVRVDGVLHEIGSYPKSMALALISRVKVMCNMDISERRFPQDARISLGVGEFSHLRNPCKYRSGA